MDSDRILRPLQALLIAAGAVFGLAPFLAPATFASLTGFKGTDVFGYRLAGAATLGYGVGLAAGWRESWPELRIPIAATFVFNLCSIASSEPAAERAAHPATPVEPFPVIDKDRMHGTWTDTISPYLSRTWSWDFTAGS